MNPSRNNQRINESTPTPTALANPEPSRLEIGSVDVAVCASLTLLMLSSYILNSSVFPIVANVFPLGREISTYCGVAFSLVIAIAAYSKPAILHESIWSFCCLGLFATGLGILFVGLSSGNMMLVALGSPFGGIGAVWFSVLVGLALINVGPKRSIVIIPTAFIAKYLTQAILSSTGIETSLESALFIYFAFTMFSYLFIRGLIRKPLSAIRTAASPTVLDVTNPSSFLPFSSPIFVSILLFNAACGYAFANSSQALTLASTLLSFVPVVIVFFVAIVARTRLSADVLYQAATLLVFAGFLAAPLALFSTGSSGSFDPSSVLLHAGSDCFSVLTYFIVASVGARNLPGALSTSAFATAAGWLGIGCGALVAQAVAGLATHNPSPTLWALACITFLFMLYNFIVLKKFSFENTIQEIRPVPYSLAGTNYTETPPENMNLIHRKKLSEKALQNAKAAKGSFLFSAEIDDATLSSVLEKNCATVAAQYGLTKREEDVLRLLARGRTSPVIQEKLFLSHNTVKTHVRHIYAKMNIHSQQELIDIVELVTAI